MKDYKEIRPSFTVDKFVDGQAPTANDASFQDMTNFIPRRGSIRSRLGITELTHTPDTTGQLYDPTKDPECVMWLRMESNATMYDCEINGDDYMYADGGYVTADTTTYYEGSGSGRFDAYTGQSANLRKLTADLPSGFPACDDESGFIFCFFLSLDWYPDVGEIVQTWYKAGSPGGSDIMGAFYTNVRRTSGQTHPYFGWTPYDKFGASIDDCFSTQVNLYADWHIGVWVSDDLELTGVRAYRLSNGQTVSWTKGCAGTSYDRGVGKFIQIGGNQTLDKFRGRLDDFIALKGVSGMTQQQIEDKIDSVRERLGYT